MVSWRQQTILVGDHQVVNYNHMFRLYLYHFHLFNRLQSPIKRQQSWVAYLRSCANRKVESKCCQCSQHLSHLYRASLRHYTCSQSFFKLVTFVANWILYLNLVKKLFVSQEPKLRTQKSWSLLPSDLNFAWRAILVVGSWIRDVIIVTGLFLLLMHVLSLVPVSLEWTQVSYVLHLLNNLLQYLMVLLPELPYLYQPTLCKI